MLSLRTILLATMIVALCLTAYGLRDYNLLIVQSKNVLSAFLIKNHDCIVYVWRNSQYGYLTVEKIEVYEGQLILKEVASIGDEAPHQLITGEDFYDVSLSYPGWGTFNATNLSVHLGSMLSIMVTELGEPKIIVLNNTIDLRRVAEVGDRVIVYVLPIL